LAVKNHADQSKAYSQLGYIETPLNIDVAIKNERQDCKRGTVYAGVLMVGGG
jgi:hypothetical protein